MNELYIGGFALAGVVIGAVQIAKLSGFPRRFAPLLASSLGTSLGLAAAWVNPDLIFLDGGIGGFMAGLTAVGIHATGKGLNGNAKTHTY